MKIVVRSNELGGASPSVVAFYPDNSDVSADAHGEGMTVISVPQNVLAYETREDGTRSPMPILAKDWRERAGSLPLHAEARRRIDDVLSVDEQMLSLHELIDLAIQHGTDISKWPQEAKDRKAEIEHQWKYIRDITERVRATKSAPANPTSDKNWPTRIKQ
jgi:hypothetical protein